jgi:FkbM family methyltransferase
MDLGITSFEYRYPLTSSGRTGKGTHQINLCGATGDHIFERIKSTNGFYEIELLECIRAGLRGQASLIVDVGANIGNHTVYFAKVIGAKVICVEPNPVVLDLLDRNIASNGITRRVSVVRAAAADVSGRATLFSGPPWNLGMTYVTQEDGRDRRDIPTLTLDEIIGSTVQDTGTWVSAIKIDVEGFEERVLTGCLRTIMRYKPIIIVEAESRKHRCRIDGILLREGYYRVGPFCATPTYVYTFGVFATTRVLIALIEDMAYSLVKRILRWSRRRLRGIVFAHNRYLNLIAIAQSIRATIL